MWSNNLLVLEIICLLLIYASGNYLVVRELSVNLMDLVLNERRNIPFAFLFYLLTVAIPIGYLYFGIKTETWHVAREFDLDCVHRLHF